MNTTEIRALVAQKIAGQGMMVDAGASLQPIVESLCNIIDAQAEQLANLKEYTAGIGIDISEQGEISTPLVVDLVDLGPMTSVSDPIPISMELALKIRSAAAIKVFYLGEIVTFPCVTPASALAPGFYRSGYNTISVFGHLLYDGDDGTMVECESVILSSGDEGGIEKYYLHPYEL